MPAFAPWLAAQNSACGQVAAAAGPMLLQGLDRIQGASRLEAASRSQPWTQEQTVGAHECQQQTSHAGLRPPAAIAPKRLAACARRSCNSTLTSRRNCSEVALRYNWALHPARMRTTSASDPVACNDCACSADTAYIWRLMVLRVTARFAHRLGTIAPSQQSAPAKSAGACCACVKWCKAKCCVRTKTPPPRTSWNCGRVLRCVH